MKLINKRLSHSLGHDIFFLTMNLIILGGLIWVPRISLPLLVSYLLSLMIASLFPTVAKLGLTKKVFLIIVLILLVGLTTLGLWQLYVLLSEKGNFISETIVRFEVLVRSKLMYFKGKMNKRLGIDIPPFYIERLVQYVQMTATNLVPRIPDFLALTLEWFFIVPFFSYFILVDGHKLKMLYLNFVPNRFLEKTYNLIFQFQKNVGDYIWAKFLEATIIGTVVTIGLLWLDFPFAILLGFIAAITNVIPYLGPFLGYLPAFVLSLVQIDSPNLVFPVFMLYAIANLVDLGLIFPLLVSKIVNLHPVIVVLSVILGSQYLGIIGMVISVPVAAIIKLTIIEIYQGLSPKRERVK